ncbi:MAG: hypothetical protein GTO54_01125, partial [Nitrososphaeria archaeon]|nr:hypothetical protein [Nitrososphaeria archaeon]
MGADGVMIAPTYAILSEEDTAVRHYALLNEAADEIQIMVYNSLKLARNFNITPNLWEKLLEFERIK